MADDGIIFLAVSVFIYRCYEHDAYDDYEQRDARRRTPDPFTGITPTVPTGHSRARTRPHYLLHTRHRRRRSCIFFYTRVTPDRSGRLSFFFFSPPVVFFTHSLRLCHSVHFNIDTGVCRYYIFLILSVLPGRVPRLLRRSGFLNTPVFAENSGGQ